MCFHSIFLWWLLCHFWCFLQRTSNSSYATSLELKNLSFWLVILGYELAGFFFALSCIKVHFTRCVFWHILCTLSTINGLRTVCVYERRITASKMCLKYEVEGRKQRSWSREKKKKVRFKLYGIQQETNEWLSKTNRGRGPILEKFDSYQASPFS